MNKKIKNDLNQMYINDMPYVVELEDGTVDYCLGKDYDDAAMILRVLLSIRRRKKKQRRQNDSTD